MVFGSVLYNSTVAVWNPWANRVEKTISIPGLSGDSNLHLSGVKIDPLDRLSMTVNAGVAFDTSGANISGDNFLVKYDLASDKILWQANLGAVTNGVYGGYQDIAHDIHGNTFAIGTFPSSVIRVTADGQAAAWYLKEPADHTIRGFIGLAPLPNGKHLLVADSSDGTLHRFDMTTELGVPETVPITGAVNNLTLMLDGMSIPSRWGGKVLLVTDNSAGTHVLYSDDASWKTAEFRGTVPNRFLATNAFATATVEIGKSIYAIFEYFLDEKVSGTLAGARSEWPLIDITANIEDLLHG
jgi:hypothetical protein